MDAHSCPRQATGPLNNGDRQRASSSGNSLIVTWRPPLCRSATTGKRWRCCARANRRIVGRSGIANAVDQNISIGDVLSSSRRDIRRHRSRFPAGLASRFRQRSSLPELSRRHRHCISHENRPLEGGQSSGDQCWRPTLALGQPKWAHAESYATARGHSGRSWT